ncbi:MAG: RidA family protein [Betaproteobacteria bacterium]|jgi:enamine deaminase RidA (YjgF/YER057c/UK114 family)
MINTPSIIAQRLESLGIKLVKPGTPAASYVMIRNAGNIIYLSGHIAKKSGKPWVGKLGLNMTTEEGYQAARSIGIDLLSTLDKNLGDLDQVEKILKMTCLVNSTQDYTDQHLVANGCSELMVEVFDSAGKHARSAFGVSQIPMGSCVEIELIVQTHSS